jgi:hypothetical protein
LTTDADGLRSPRTGPFIQLELLSPRAPRVRGSRLSSTVRRGEASRRRGASVRLRVSRLRQPYAPAALRLSAARTCLWTCP